jgi:hypothetical protein
MNVGNLATLLESAVFVSELVAWERAAVVGALVQALVIAAVQATVLGAHVIIAAQAMAMVLGAHAIVAAQAMAMVLGVHHLGEEVGLQSAGGVFHPWFVEAEAQVVLLLHDGIVVHLQLLMGALFLSENVVAAAAEVLKRTHLGVFEKV